MTCAEVNQKIEFFVLGELSEPQQVAIKQHLTTCPTCSATEADYRLLVNDIKKAVQPDLPKLDFVRAVRSAVDTEIQTVVKRSLVKRLIITISSIAACLLFGLATWQVWVYSVHKAESVVVKRPSAKLPLAVLPPFDSPTVLQAWQYRGALSTRRSVADGVVVSGQNIHFLQDGGSRAHVTALDAKTGEQRWLSDIESCGYLVADDFRIYCLAPTDPGGFDLVALDRTNGKMLWRYPQQYPDRLHSPCHPTILSGGRICWTTNTTIHMLDSADGKILWTHSIPNDGLLSKAVIVGDSLYVANSAKLYCLNTTSGEETWQHAWGNGTSGLGRPLLAVTNREVYAAFELGFRGSRLLCMELTGHRALWSKVIPHTTHLYATGDRVYLRNQNVQALDRTTGEVLWTCPAVGCSPVTCVDGLVYFVDSSDQGHLIALNEHTGCKVWELVGMSSCSTFIKVNSSGYLKTHDGVVHAIVFKG